LSQLGYDVRVTQKGDRDEDATISPGFNVRFVRAPVRTWSDLLFACRTRSSAREADLCCYATPELGFPFYSSKGFAVQHGISWDNPQCGAARALVLRSLQKLRNLLMCKSLRLIICVDTNYINYLRAFGGAAASACRRCVYVPNYADLTMMPTVTDADLRRRFHSKTLLFLRRFEKHRGPDLFVDVCQELRIRGIAFRAKMVGDGSQLEHTRNIIEAYGLSGLVEISRCGFDDAYAIANEASISVVPSVWSEGTSLAAVESIALGVPVVATDVGGLGNLILPEYNGFLTRPNPTDLARYVERLLTDEETYMRMARRCLDMRDALSYERWRAAVVEALEACGLIGRQFPVGVSDGSRSVAAGGAAVTKDVPARSAVGAVPAGALKEIG
jgi:glycosyltransferase involved in cell wall biosynthesis